MTDSKKVFALRKEGKLDEALDLGREVFRNDSQDNWNIRALAWSLHDSIKVAGKNQDHEQQHSLITELLQLPIPSKDEILNKTCDYWRATLESGLENRSLFKECTQLRKAGQLQEAWELAEELTSQHPDQIQAWNERGWILFNFLKQELELEKPNKDRILQLFGQYQEQQQHEMPGLLHSAMLNLAVRAARINLFDEYCAFFQWWDPLNHYREDDWVPFIPSEIESPTLSPIKIHCLAEKAASALNKSLPGIDDQEILKWALSVLEALLAKVPDHDWAPLWKSRVLIALDQKESARNLLIPLARRKSSESWVWKGLADTYAIDDDLHRALLAKACLCGRNLQEVFSLSIYQSLAEALILRSQKTEALFFLEKIQTVRNEKQYSTAKVDEQMADSLFANISAATVKEVDGQLVQWARSALPVLSEGLPKAHGLFLRHSSTQSEQASKSTLGIFHEDQLWAIPAPNSLVFQDSLQPGSPLELSYEKHGDRFHVLHAEVVKGELWQGSIPCLGVVDYVNEVKGFTCVEIGGKKPTYLYHDHLPQSQSLLPGSTVEMDCALSGSQQRKQAYRFVEVSGMTPEWLKEASGELWMPTARAFGFVDLNEGVSVFVSPSLIEKHQLNEGDHLNFQMVRKWDKSKNRMGWSAISLL